MSQGRPAGTPVVDVDLHPEIVKFRQALVGDASPGNNTLSVISSTTVAGSWVRGPQKLGDLADECVPGELASRDVHAHPQFPGDRGGVLPHRRLSQGLFHDAGPSRAMSPLDSAMPMKSFGANRPRVG